MSIFPQLKTGSVVQYPIIRRSQFRNQTVMFVDGTTQRYRDSGGPRFRWEIQCSGLDEGELAALEEFFRASEGAFARFTFTDPWDGKVYDDCSLGSDDLELITAGELRNGTRLTVVRNR